MFKFFKTTLLRHIQTERAVSVAAFYSCTAQHDSSFGVHHVLPKEYVEP